MARRDAAGVQLLTHNGIDWSFRFPLIVQAVGALRAAQGVAKCDCSPGRASRAAAASVTVGKIRAEAHAVAVAGFPALGPRLNKNRPRGQRRGVMG